MKTSSLIVALSVALSVMAAPQGNSRQGSNVSRQNNNRFGFGGNGGNSPFNQNQNGGKNGNTANNNNNGKNNANNGQNASNNGQNAGTGNSASNGAATTGANNANNSTAATGANNANNSTAATGANNANNSTAATGANNANNSTAATGGATSTTDPQASLTLDPKVIATGFADDGQDVPTDGQIASLTSTNNFINFCLTVPNLPITNGKQITTGSCNPAPMGVIPSTDNMPSSKFVSPKNGDTLKENTPFTITMAIQNMQTGFFVNAAANYFAAPQQLNSAGQIVGHSHVVVELLSALDQTTPTDPKKFAFFKGLNAAASGGQLTADVTAGLPSGFYKLSSINSASNHQPVLVSVAQHGSLDDAVYFTITADGNAVAGATGNSTATAGGAANSTVAAGGAVVKGNAAPVASAAPVAGNTNKNNNKNQNAGAKNQGKNAGNGRSFLRRRL